MCVLIFSTTLFETLLVVIWNERDMIWWSSRKVPFILVQFYWHFNFFDRFSKNLQISNFMKIRLGGAEFFHAEGRTDRRKDMTKLIVAFRNFANAPNIRLSGLWSRNYTRIRWYGAQRNLRLGRISWENNNVQNGKLLPTFITHKIYIKYALQNYINTEMWLYDISIFKTFRMAKVGRRNIHLRGTLLRYIFLTVLLQSCTTHSSGLQIQTCIWYCYLFSSRHGSASYKSWIISNSSNHAKNV
jgi:hypothetical protein